MIVVYIGFRGYCDAVKLLCANGHIDEALLPDLFENETGSFQQAS